jgi:hypothetical protein
MQTVLDEYFVLTDRANFDKQAIPQLIELFADEAEVKPAGGERVKGKEAIAKLLQKFYQSYSTVQRVWNTRPTDNGIEAVWAVAGKKSDGEVFAVHGRHIAEVDEAGKIAKLEVELLTDDRS